MPNCPYCSAEMPEYVYRVAVGQQFEHEDSKEHCIMEISCSECGRVISVQYCQS